MYYRIRLSNELNELKGINIRILGQSRTVSRAYTETTCGICFQKKMDHKRKTEEESPSVEKRPRIDAMPRFEKELGNSVFVVVKRI